MNEETLLYEGSGERDRERERERERERGGGSAVMARKRPCVVLSGFAVPPSA